MMTKEDALLLKNLIETYARRVSNHDRHCNEISYRQLQDASDNLQQRLAFLTKIETR